MITAALAFQNAIALEVTRLSRLWEITRADGVVLRFADHDIPLVYGGQTFKAAEGFSASAIHTAARSRVQGVAVDFLLAAGGVTESDIRGRLYDGAKCKLYVIERDSATAITVYAGVFGEATITDFGYARVEVGSLRRGGAIITKIFQANCRADLGDADCTVDIEALKEAFTITTVLSASAFNAALLTQPNGEWDLGVVVWATGANAGYAMEVANSLATGEIRLLAAPQFVMAAGDTGFVYPGCSKFPSMCRDRYSNMPNYRGEPFPPQPTTVS